MKRILLYIFILTAASCAKLPYQSVLLMETIMSEGERMHKTNISLLDGWFREKEAGIDSFMNNVYIPEYIAEVKAGLPASVNMDEVWPDLMAAMIPEINARRDSIRRALANMKEQVINKLNEEHALYLQGCNTQKDLLSSNVKVNNSRTELFNQFKSLTGDKIDLNALEPVINKLIDKGGSLADNIETANSQLEKILKRKKA